MKRRITILALAAVTLAFPAGAPAAHHEPPAELCRSDNAASPELPATPAIQKNAAANHCANR